MYFKLTKKGGSLVELVLKETRTRGRNIAVNSTALDLVRELDMEGVKADFETTDGFSTKVFDSESGEPLYDIKSFKKRDKVLVGVYPLNKTAKSYLKNLASS